jgi:hypothetical protein
MIAFWKKNKQAISNSHEVKSALMEADKALNHAQTRAEEAKHLATSLFKSRQENHYAQRIKAAYELETR